MIKALICLLVVLMTGCSAGESSYGSGGDSWDDGTDGSGASTATGGASSTFGTGGDTGTGGASTATGGASSTGIRYVKKNGRITLKGRIALNMVSSCEFYSWTDTATGNECITFVSGMKECLDKDSFYSVGGVLLLLYFANADDNRCGSLVCEREDICLNNYYGEEYPGSYDVGKCNNINGENYAYILWNMYHSDDGSLSPCNGDTADPQSPVNNSECQKYNNPYAEARPFFDDSFKCDNWDNVSGNNEANKQFYSDPSVFD